MIAPTLKLGGPLAIACTWCKAPVDERCTRKVWGTSGATPCRLHSGRVKAAPPEQEARAGDLVLVQVGGVHLAQLVAIGENCTVRIWRAGAQAFASPRLVSRAAVLSLAPEDVRAKLAKEQLDVEARAAKTSLDAALARGARGVVIVDRKPVADVTNVEIREVGHSPSEPSPAPVTRAPDPWFASMPPETTGGKGW